MKILIVTGRCFPHSVLGTGHTYTIARYPEILTIYSRSMMRHARTSSNLRGRWLSGMIGMAPKVGGEIQYIDPSCSCSGAEIGAMQDEWYAIAAALHTFVSESEPKPQLPPSP